MGNVTFTEPIGCVACGAEIKTWDLQCFRCETEYDDDAWAEIIAFLFDVGEYGHLLTTLDARIALQEKLNSAKSTTYRAQYEAYVEEITQNCLRCGKEDSDCTCSADEWFSLSDWLFTPDSVKNTHFYHSALTLPNVQYEQSCFNCVKQYTIKCNKLPEQLLTLDHNDRPAYKLDTCEYIEVNVIIRGSALDIYTGTPDDQAPF